MKTALKGLPGSQNYAGMLVPGLAVMLALCITPLPAFAVMESKIVPLNKEQVDRRFGQVKRLIQQSTAAQRVKQSDRPDVHVAYENVLALFDSANVEFRAEHLEEANQLLTQVSRNMFETARKTDARELLNHKRKRDFQSRKSSVDALLLAHGRISQEEHQLKTHKELKESVDHQLAKATTHVDLGDYIAGRKELDNAYLEIKTSIGDLRDGDTLVRSLSFASNEEEYHYELDRNDTHRMLVTVLAAEKMDSNTTMKKLVDNFLQKAAALRTEAEELATKGHYKSSIKRLEESTGQVLRAIRSAGVYIPGG